MSELGALVPILIVAVSAAVVLFAEAFRRPGEHLPMGGLGLIGVGGATVAAVLLWHRGTVSFGVVRADEFALFVMIVLCLIGAVTIIFSAPLIDRDDVPAGEYYSLLLFAVSGMMLMAAATDLLLIFLALEILSVGVYALTGIRRTTLKGTEAAFKYFLLGSLSSAFFLYGVALTFVVGGSTRLDRIGAALAAPPTDPAPLTLVAVGLVLVGFAFKVSAVPFHMWTPDAYEGAPAVVAGFMSTAVKVAALAGFVRVFSSAFAPLRADWTPVLWVLAVATMVVGTVVGVAQTNVKRMLAYSSIAHAGYLLIGLVAANAAGKAAVLFYLVAYGLMNLGAFGVVAVVGTRTHANDELSDFAGLADSQPGLAALMTVFLVSLGGLPPTAGFIGKWYLFSAAVQDGQYALAVVGVLTSIVATFFYLRIVVLMYMTGRQTDHPRSAPTRAVLITLAAAAIGIFYLGLLPARVLEIAIDSVAAVS